MQLESRDQVYTIDYVSRECFYSVIDRQNEEIH